ncbi:hypothetical protein C2S52_016760 [Perilla frutescens var. hirtella]|uniref:Ferredoxin thioredoxin reductase alpha chain domain-containing protein n=1 Tax=Perilla frutescens var. hirtella TaxID=608512 RepID=A0AAD4PFB9_PERFH|nr:hypothetical protein C2S52_016760 [Perilla frutescens var. hirtella]KAH6810598.1 hypothetical protein C2S51_024360 [Perilla frutescens var. frutescens]KAH6836847.1 hypothetical protein C2S53_008559 [Perilla frutescens var. hirtella]
MATSPAFYSSILNLPNSKISNSDLGFNKIRFWVQKNQSFTPANPISIADSCPSSSGSCNSAAIYNSLTLDHDSINDEEVKKAESRIGSRVGLLKQYVAVFKGKRISANLPYKVEFVAEEVSGRDGKPVKFSAHLREDGFEFLD